MKLGIIGTGKICQEFLPHFKNMENVEIVAMLSTLRSLEKNKELCAAYDIPFATSSFEEFIESDIDTVYICVPNDLHYDYGMKCLHNNKHVIMEKPIASTYHEAFELVQLAKEKHVFLFEAISTIYLDNFRKIKEWLPRIGEIKLVQSQYSQYSSRYDAFKKGEILPAFDPNKAGGALMDLNLYNFYYVIDLFGSPNDVHYYANLERNIDTSGIAILEYPTFQATCTAAKDSKGAIGGIIQGTKGVIRSYYPPNVVGPVSLELNDGTKEEYDDKMFMKRMVPELNTFYDAITNQDYEFCYQALNESLEVIKALTKARKDANIVFPNDSIN